MMPISNRLRPFLVPGGCSYTQGIDRWAGGSYGARIQNGIGELVLKETSEFSDGALMSSCRLYKKVNTILNSTIQIKFFL